MLVEAVLAPDVGAVLPYLVAKASRQSNLCPANPTFAATHPKTHTFSRHPVPKPTLFLRCQSSASQRFGPHKDHREAARASITMPFLPPYIEEYPPLPPFFHGHGHPAPPTAQPSAYHYHTYYSPPAPQLGPLRPSAPYARFPPGTFGTGYCPQDAAAAATQAAIRKQRVDRIKREMAALKKQREGNGAKNGAADGKCTAGAAQRDIKLETADAAQAMPTTKSASDATSDEQCD